MCIRDRYKAELRTELGAGYFNRGQYDVALEELDRQPEDLEVTFERHGGTRYSLSPSSLRKRNPT